MLPNRNSKQDLAEGPWNPGINSDLTRELLALSTLFRSENILNDLQQALELRDVTGLPLEDLAVFRPERLALHEVLVRVTADFEVPDPENATIPSLGVNFRQIVQTFLSRAVEPNHSDLAREYHRLRQELTRIIEDELSTALASPGPSATSEQSRRALGGLWGWLR